MKEILKQKLLDLLDEKYFKRICWVYINYTNHPLTGLIQYLNDDDGTISIMDIEEIEQKIKQE